MASRQIAANREQQSNLASSQLIQTTRRCARFGCRPRFAAPARHFPVVHPPLARHPAAFPWRFRGFPRGEATKSHSPAAGKFPRGLRRERAFLILPPGRDRRSSRTVRITRATPLATSTPARPDAQPAGIAAVGPAVTSAASLVGFTGSRSARRDCHLSRTRIGSGGQVRASPGRVACIGTCAPSSYESWLREGRPRCSDAGVNKLGACPRPPRPACVQSDRPACTSRGFS